MVDVNKENNPNKCHMDKDGRKKNLKRNPKLSIKEKKKRNRETWARYDRSDKGKARTKRRRKS